MHLAHGIHFHYLFARSFVHPQALSETIKQQVRQTHTNSCMYSFKHRATTSHCFLSSSRIRASGARSWGLRRPWPPSFAKCNLHWDALRSRMSRVNRSTPVLQTNLHSSPLLHSHTHAGHVCSSVWLSQGGTSARRPISGQCEPAAIWKPPNSP